MEEQARGGRCLYSDLAFHVCSDVIVAFFITQFTCVGVLVFHVIHPCVFVLVRVCVCVSVCVCVCGLSNAFHKYFDEIVRL